MTEEAPRLMLPQAHKAKVMIWADLSVADTDHLDECVTPDQVKSELSRIFHLDDATENPKTAVLLDLYFYTIQFCRENKYSKEQTSTLFSIVKNLHQICTETPFENLEECFNNFKETILCHAVKRPPFSIDLFSPEEVRKITKYVITTYFRHYKMYKYVFTPLVRLDLSMSYPGMPETPPASGAGDPENKETEEGEGEEKSLENAEDQGSQQEEVVANEQNTDVKEESPAAAKLRKLIKEELTKEVNNLRQSFDEQLKASENSLNAKISAVDGNQGDKKGKTSARSKKK